MKTVAEKRKSPSDNQNESQSKVEKEEILSNDTNSGRRPKKQKNGNTNSDSQNGTQQAKSKSTASVESSSTTSTTATTTKSFEPLTLSEIKSSIENLSTRIPTIPSSGLDPNNHDQVREWALSMQAIIEEFNLLLTCIATATYKWGTDRTGAADQNLALLSNELANSQEQISASVTQRLTNVLAPVVELVTKETIVKKVKDEKTGEEYERRINHFTREDNDPNFIHLCNLILCRNAVMLRHVVLTNFHKVGKCIQDYLTATKKDGNHGRSAFY
jgi:hypothetical protein